MIDKLMEFHLKGRSLLLRKNAQCGLLFFHSRMTFVHARSYQKMSFLLIQSVSKTQRKDFLLFVLVVFMKCLSVKFETFLRRKVWGIFVYLLYLHEISDKGAKVAHFYAEAKNLRAPFLMH